MKEKKAFAVTKRLSQNVIKYLKFYDNWINLYIF